MSTSNKYIHLNAINGKTRNKLVVVRILRLWIQKDITGREGIEMIVVDEMSNKIQATISTGLKNRFMQQLKEGQIYVIENFQALENNPSLQNAKINHQWRIGFGLATKVSEPKESIDIVKDGFQFVPFKEIQSHDTMFVLDIFDEVKTDTITIEWVDFKSEKASKCNVTLEDADGTQITCVLWESFADELKSFMESKKIEDKEPVLVALQFAKISTFKGKILISTMKHATRFFIRPEIQEVKEFILRRGVTENLLSHSITNISSIGGELKSEDWLNGSLARTIKKMVNSDEVGTYICKGTIRDLHPTESWYYEACGNERCYKGVAKGTKVGDYCKKCKRPIGSIHIRYLMKVLVDDDDIEQTYFTLFEDCALYFLKKTADQLMEEMENETGDRNGIPDVLTTMLDRQCLFKVEVGTRFGDRVYIVKKITEDADIMAQFSNISPDEEVASKYKGSTNFTGKNAKDEDHIEIIEESCSNSTSIQITPQKRSPNDLYQDHTDGDDLQLSSTKILKK